MEKRAYCPFSVKNFPKESEIPFEPFEIDPAATKAIYENCFYGKPNENPMQHLRTFNERCKDLNMSNKNNSIIKVKKFPYSLAGKALDWILKWPPGNFSSWFNVKAAFVERFGTPEVIGHLREMLIMFKILGKI